MNPTGNQTILVDTMIPEVNQPDTAAKLMQLEPSAEQVGFLSPSQNSDISLRMAGGEFCGNAAMSAAVSCGIKRGWTKGTFAVSISGADQPVKVQILNTEENVWEGTVEMPRPNWIQTVTFSSGQSFPVVSFPGIAHVMVKDSLPSSEAEKLAVSFCRELGAKALGMMFLDAENYVLTPLVYVPAAETLFWESTCASGTTAVGAWMANEAGREIAAQLRQPGGILEIYAETNGALQLKGHVSCVYEKTVLMDY